MSDKMTCGSAWGGNDLVIVQMGYTHYQMPRNAARELAEAAMDGKLRNISQAYVGGKYVYSEGDRIDFQMLAREVESPEAKAERQRAEELEKLRKRVAELESERQEPTPTAPPSQDFPL